MTTHVKITDKPLVRDINSKAILNTDRNALNEYLIRRDVARKKSQEQEEIKMRLATVEEDMRDIKRLLQEIIQLRNTNGN